MNDLMEFSYTSRQMEVLRQVPRGRGLARYGKVLPVDEASIPFLGEGDTPTLVPVRLAQSLGLPNLLLKNEALNPTGSFKDRGICISTAAAIESGAQGVMTISSGNGAASLATYAALCGLKCLVLVDSDASTEKIRQIRFMGAVCLQVKGLFEKGVEPLLSFVEELCGALDFQCAFSFAPVNPYSIEGSKTIAYECAPFEPDVVVCPAAGGDNLSGQWKGYNELHTAGVLKKLPRMIAVQADGAAPLVEAFHSRAHKVKTLEKMNSDVFSLRTTFSGDHALKALYESGGYALTVTGAQCAEYRRMLAVMEGVWVEKASASVVAALPSLLAQGAIQEKEKVLCVLTGAGYKEAVDGGHMKEAADVRFDVTDVLGKYQDLCL